MPTETATTATTVTIAGQTWTVIHRSRYFVGLINARGTARQLVPNLTTGTCVLTDMIGRQHKNRFGTAVRCMVVGDVICEIA